MTLIRSPGVLRSTKESLVIMCEHDLAAMTLNHFEYDDAYAWYHFQCQSCGKRRLVSISLDDVVNEQADGNVYEKITTKDLK